MISARLVDSEAILKFDSVMSLANSAEYMHFCWISIVGEPKERIQHRKLPDLPPQLTALNLEWTEVTELPRLPDTLVTLSAKSCRIETWPHTRQCINLETILLSDNYIQRLDKHVANTVMTIDLSFNKLDMVDYDKLSLNLANLNVSYNYLKTIPPFNRGVTINASHNNFGERHYVRNVIQQRANGEQQSTTYSNSQNVHLTSVQNSATSAVKIILQSKRRPNYLQEIQHTFAIRRLPAHSALSDWCSESHVHSVHGITYGELLQHVWSIIWNHNNRSELTKILYDELQASTGLCSTGRFTRTINALTGFVNGIVVTISDKEELQNRMSTLIANAHADSDDLYREAEQILDQYKLNDNEKNIWLDAVREAIE